MYFSIDLFKIYTCNCFCFDFKIPRWRTFFKTKFKWKNQCERKRKNWSDHNKFSANLEQFFQKHCKTCLKCYYTDLNDKRKTKNRHYILEDWGMRVEWVGMRNEGWWVWNNEVWWGMVMDGEGWWRMVKDGDGWRWMGLIRDDEGWEMVRNK